MKATILGLFLASAAFTFGQIGTLDFVENLGQFPDQVNFKANLYNGNVYLEDNCFTFVFHNKEDLDHHHDDVVGMDGEHHHEDAEFVRSHAFKTHFLGANKELATMTQELKALLGQFKL